jgi:ribonuclease HI
MIMMETILSLTRDKMILSCILLWDWWTARNKVNGGEAAKPESVICSTIQKHAFEFNVPLMPIVSESGDTGSRLNTEDVKWIRPGQDQVKVNVDASYWEPSKTGSWGFVVRDDKGEFVAAAAGKLRHLRSALQAETEALVAAVEGAAALSLNRVIFESDSKILVDALNSSSHELSEIGILLREARSLCVVSFDSFQFKHCSRVCNKIAHTLAKFGSQADEECVGWADIAPDFVSDLVASESAEP